MQIIEHSIVGTRSAVLRLRRRDTPLEFLLFPMLHVASPQFYARATARFTRPTELAFVRSGGTPRGNL